MNVASLVKNKKNPKIPDIVPGDTVKVSARIVEGGKERIQVFQGVVIKVKKGGPSASFTVRHVAFGIGVERTFPFASPLVEKVEIVRHGKVRRAKLYYLRGLSGRQARRKIKRVEKKVEDIKEEIGEDLLAVETEEVLEPEEVLGEEGKMIAVAEQEEAVEEPKAEEVVEKPVTEESVAEEPEVAVAPEAETKEAAEASAEPAEEVVEEPVVEEEKTAAETVAEEVTEEPKAEQQEELVAEVTTEKPKPEDENS